MNLNPESYYLVIADPESVLQRPQPIFRVGEIVVFKEKIYNFRDDFFIFLFEPLEPSDKPKWLELTLTEVEPDWGRYFQEVK